MLKCIQEIWKCAGNVTPAVSISNLQIFYIAMVIIKFNQACVFSELFCINLSTVITLILQWHHTACSPNGAQSFNHCTNWWCETGAHWLWAWFLNFVSGFRTRWFPKNLHALALRSAKPQLSRYLTDPLFRSETPFSQVRYHELDSSSWKFLILRLSYTTLRHALIWHRIDLIL